ncbi:MAG: hypothetical protein RIR70_1791 [Pseudomonadota bacterium]|jgi:steroid delta-isomerase
MRALDELIDCYESITPEGVSRLASLYATDALFKDPFNEVRGQAAIAKIFSHMFTQVEAPRFKVVERMQADNAAMLVWEFSFGPANKRRLIRGATHLKFDSAGAVCVHRDYWDAAEELYAKVPVLGWLMAGLRRLVAA